MSDKTINLCGNMLMSVKMHFSGNTEILGFEKATIFFMGFRIHFFFSSNLYLEIVKNRFSKKRK